MTADEIAEQLHLEPLPEEGGYFRRIFTHSIRMEAEALPPGFTPPRELLTGIYYLVTPQGFSALHRLQPTETFHFHAGDTLEMLQLQENGPCGWKRIGTDLQKGEEPFVVVPGGTWQGTRLAPGGSHGWALLSVMVSPGFDWQDFELGERTALTGLFPAWAKPIRELTR